MSLASSKLRNFFPAQMDGAKGLEPQTRKLFEVARMR